MGMTGGDAVQQLLAEISDDLDDWAFPPSTARAKDRLVAALTAVLDLLDDREKRTREWFEQQRYPNPREMADLLATVKVSTLRAAVAAALQEQP